MAKSIPDRAARAQAWSTPAHLGAERPGPGSDTVRDGEGCRVSGAAVDHIESCQLLG